MLDKYLYLIFNPLKIKTLLLQTAHAFRSSSIPYYVIK